MLNIDVHTLPARYEELSHELEAVRDAAEPAFARYTPDYETLYSLAAKYARISCFVLIGRGGSVTGFRALYHALAKYRTTKRVFILDTLDPDYTAHVRSRCPPEDTLVLAVSKSGNTVEVIENLLAFKEYKKLIITAGQESGLGRLAEVKQLETVRHPEIGGRFSTRTECAMLPAALIYVDARSIVHGMAAMSQECAPAEPVERNPALRLAASLLLAERAGWTEAYAPVYSKLLAGSAELWTQLMHETVCKDGKGQTFLFMEAPECQHHTNQKFFDGPRRALGLFTRVEHPGQDHVLRTDSQEAALRLEELSFSDLDGEPLSAAQRHEWSGMRQAADKLGIPNATITLERVTPEGFGRLTAFWEHVAVYSALLRGLDPYSQPGVELSKRLAVSERRKA